jgi:hypothetical protein
VEALVVMAREAHLKSQDHTRLAGHFRAQRNDAIRRLYADGGYSYSTLARQVELPRELVVKIIQTGRRDGSVR